jgi:hypothetical protein
MKISEMISKLEQIKHHIGDVDVIHSMDDEGNIYREIDRSSVVFSFLETDSDDESRKYAVVIYPGEKEVLV